MPNSKKLSVTQQAAMLAILEERFSKYAKNLKAVKWGNVKEKLLANPQKIWSLQEMENTGGEPNMVAYNAAENLYIFFDCSPETPKGRRSICYDRDALEARKEFKPATTAIDMANTMGVTLLTEKDYYYLQTLGTFDTKTSSWLHTPEAVRKLGGALFADYRFGRTFVYHNGASSYYGGRGFRAVLNV